MSDESIGQPEDSVSRADFENLQEQLKAAKADRDRQSFEKSEIVAKANAFAKERDDAKAELAAAHAAREKAAADLAAVSAELDTAKRRAQDAIARGEEAVAEIRRLRNIIDTAPSTDPAEVLWTLVSDKTRTAVAWVRAKIPADSPILPYFDKTVETVTRIGCATIKLTREFIVWATPKVIELSKQGVAKVEELLAKK